MTDYYKKFEGPYKPTRLRNWEVPKWHPKRPCANHGSTTIISNDSGNLLPGVPRKKIDLWGNYIGTWHYPKRITREIANKLSAPREDRILAWKKHCEKSKAITLKKQNRKENNVITAKEPEPIIEEGPKEEIENVENEKLNDVKKNAIVPYVPGDFTDEKFRHISHEYLVKYRHNPNEIYENVPPRFGYPRIREDFTRLPDRETKDLKSSSEEVYRKHREMLTEQYVGNECYGCKKDKRWSSPILAAIKNFDLAKKLHKENLEHQPLPDTVTDALYRKLQMQNHREPGLALKEGNYASGVAWKAYAGYGPTRCTKLKVFRPKTGICHKIKDSANDRPSSVNSFDKKWRFIRQTKVTPIQLAVCWDLTPINPKDEPKRTPHIDGSNGSMAPAVFSLVHTPDETNRKSSNEDLDHKCDGLHDYGNLPYMYDPEAYRPKTASNSKTPSTNGSSQPKRAQSAVTRIANFPNPIFTHLPPNSPELTKMSGYKYCSKDCRQKGRKFSRKHLCVACELRNINLKDAKPKSEFKMAFKAGVPQKVSTLNLCDTLRIPKMKDPYKKRNYTINSLAPPFSLQNYKRHDYPEHWRLATVYQHSYKPLQARKRPLLNTVFK